MRAASGPPAEAWLRFSLFTKTSCAAHEVLVCSASMYVLGRVWRRRASEFGPRAKTWASCNVLEIRVTRLAQHLLAPLYAGALTPPLNPPFRGLHSRGPRGSFARNTEFFNINSGHVPSSDVEFPVLIFTHRRLFKYKTRQTGISAFGGTKSTNRAPAL